MKVSTLFSLKVILSVVVRGGDGLFIWSTTPKSRRFDALIGEWIELKVEVESHFQIHTNWTVNNNLDISKNGSIGSSMRDYLWTAHLRFKLLSATYYGTYTCTLKNERRNTTVVFEVVPPGPPDPPANFQISEVTHYSIYVKWNCMQSNHNHHTQRIYTVLREVGSNVTVGVLFSNVSGTCFNLTHSVCFDSNINPDTEYVATVNSTNDHGTRDTVALRVRTVKPVQLHVSPGTIQVNYPEVSIGFQIDNNISREYALLITCTVENTGQSVWNLTKNISKYNNGSLSLFIDPLVNTTEYVFDFTVLILKSYDPYVNRYWKIWRSHFLDEPFVPLQATKGVRVKTAKPVNLTNDLRNSETSKLPIRTATLYQLQVSSDTIQVNYPRASISFRIPGHNVFRAIHILIVCTAEYTGQSISLWYPTYDTINNNYLTVAMNLDRLVNTTEYVFDIILINSSCYCELGQSLSCQRVFTNTRCALQSMNGVRVNSTTPDGDEFRLTSIGSVSFVAIIVSVVLVVSVIIILFITFFIWKNRRQNSTPSTDAKKIKPGVNNSEVHVEEIYEHMRHRGSDNRTYAELQHLNINPGVNNSRVEELYEPMRRNGNDNRTYAELQVDLVYTI